MVLECVTVEFGPIGSWLKGPESFVEFAWIMVRRADLPQRRSMRDQIRNSPDPDVNHAALTEQSGICAGINLAIWSTVRTVAPCCSETN